MLSSRLAPWIASSFKLSLTTNVLAKSEYLPFYSPLFRHSHRSPHHVRRRLERAIRLLRRPPTHCRKYFVPLSRLHRHSGDPDAGITGHHVHADCHPHQPRGDGEPAIEGKQSPERSVGCATPRIAAGQRTTVYVAAARCQRLCV